jgi:hypothetical protein
MGPKADVRHPFRNLRSPLNTGSRPTVNQVNWPLRGRKEQKGRAYRSLRMSGDPTTPPIAFSAAAQRMRAHRKRREAGLRCLTIELRETEVTELIRRNLLDADARHDANAVRKALYRHLDDTLRGRR